jgi:plasmid stabilization system protein ParE
MIRQIVLTDRANGQMEAIYQWWAENRSKGQAAKWYNTFADAIESLAHNPERCAVSRENGRFPFEIRDLNFGVGRRRTHRAVFTIRHDIVLVLAIRHLGQQNLSPDDL